MEKQDKSLQFLPIIFPELPIFGYKY